jgi:hypothetical protein
MSNESITIENLIRELKLKSYNQNEYIFFQELIDEIYKLTKNRKIYRNGIVFFGKKRCVINNLDLALHCSGGTFSHVEQIEPDGSSQTFRKDDFSYSSLKQI